MESKKLVSEQKKSTALRAEILSKATAAGKLAKAGRRANSRTVMIRINPRLMVVLPSKVTSVAASQPPKKSYPQQPLPRATPSLRATDNFHHVNSSSTILVQDYQVSIEKDEIATPIVCSPQSKLYLISPPTSPPVRLPVQRSRSPPTMPFKDAVDSQTLKKSSKALLSTSALKKSGNHRISRRDPKLRKCLVCSSMAAPNRMTRSCGLPPQVSRFGFEGLENKKRNQRLIRDYSQLELFGAD